MNSFRLTSTTEQDHQLQAQRLEHDLSRIAAGDPEGLRALYEETRGSVYGFALSILKSVQDAEDVLQETYIRIHGAAGRYQPQGRPLAWILTITRNLAMMKLRERGRRADPEEFQWEQFSLPDNAQGVEDRLTLLALLQNLSDEERQIVVLHAVSGFKHREIAALLQRPLPTVLSKYHRAMKKLRTMLEVE